MEEIFEEIKEEETRQADHRKATNDNCWNGADFLSFINKQVHQYRNDDFNEFKHLDWPEFENAAHRMQRSRLVRIAALALAGIQTIDHIQAAEGKE